MAKDKRYYWMKLQEGFFENETIEWIGEQPNGDTYIIFLLKLCLKALKTNGVLIRAVGNIFIPYEVEKLAEMTKIDVDTVRVAMTLFQQIGLIEVWEGGEIYVAILEDMVGSETEWAAKKRLYRGTQERLSRREHTEEGENNEDKTADNVRNMSDKSIENKRIEKEKEEKESKKEKVLSSGSAEFSLFWKMYPNKKNKKTAESRWNRLGVTPELYKKIMSGLERAMASREWAKDDGEYIPHPASWLNAAGWENEYKPIAEQIREAEPGAANVPPKADALAGRLRLMGGD